MDKLAPTRAPNKTLGNLIFQIIVLDESAISEISIYFSIKDTFEPIILNISNTLTLAVPIVVNNPIANINEIISTIIIRLYLVLFLLNYITPFYSNASGCKARAISSNPSTILGPGLDMIFPSNR